MRRSIRADNDDRIAARYVCAWSPVTRADIDPAKLERRIRIIIQLQTDRPAAVPGEIENISLARLGRKVSLIRLPLCQQIQPGCRSLGFARDKLSSLCFAQL